MWPNASLNVPSTCCSQPLHWGFSLSFSMGAKLQRSHYTLAIAEWWRGGLKARLFLMNHHVLIAEFLSAQVFHHYKIIQSYSAKEWDKCYLPRAEWCKHNGLVMPFPPIEQQERQPEGPAEGQEEDSGERQRQEVQAMEFGSPLPEQRHVLETQVCGMTYETVCT